VRSKLSVESPPPIQHLAEVVVEGITGLMEEVIGKNSGRFFPLIGSLAIYILIGNLLGMVPGFLSPTSNLNITASCAICVFIYYNYVGIRKHGFLGYLKHFAGSGGWPGSFFRLRSSATWPGPFRSVCVSLATSLPKN
jgi:F-type H+-transporting ATPase subunit a